MAIGDRTKRRREQVCNNAAEVFHRNGNLPMTCKGLIESMLGQGRVASGRRYTSMRYMPTATQLAMFLKIDKRFEEKSTRAVKEYRLTGWKE